MVQRLVDFVPWMFGFTHSTEEQDYDDHQPIGPFPPPGSSMKKWTRFFTQYLVPVLHPTFERGCETLSTGITIAAAR